jgi:hypothetical protein
MNSPVLRELLVKASAALLGVSLSRAVAFMLSPGVTAKKFVPVPPPIMRGEVEDSTPPPGLSPPAATVLSGTRSRVLEGGWATKVESSKLKYEITVASALGTIKPVRIKEAAVATRSERNERPLICGDKTALFVFIAW